MKVLQTIPTNIDELCVNQFNESQQKLHDEIVNELLNSSITFDKDFALSIYSKSNSIAQSHRVVRGKLFEHIIENILIDCNIPFMKQVVVDDHGMIIQRTNTRHKIIHDIVIDANIGDRLSDNFM